MNNKIVDFFKFLEEKKGTKTPLKFKLIHHDKFKLTKEELNVEGSLNLEDTGIATLPDNLTINGNLFITNSKITLLPDNLNVNGFLNLRYTDVMILPDNLNVKRSIWVDKKKLDYFKTKYTQYNFDY